MTKEAEPGTSDEIQFDFEEDDKLPFDDDEGYHEEDAAIEEPPRKGLRQALSQRTFLFGLLLLLVLGGGGYYYLSETPAPPAPKPAAPVKTKVAVQPVPPAPAPKAATAPTATAGKPAPPVAPTATAVKTASPPPVAATPVKSSQPAPVAKEAAAAPAKSVPAVKTPAPATAAVAPAEAGSEVAAPAPPAARQPFTLTVGTFLNQKHQREIEKKIRRLGYVPKLQTTYSMVPMTRLLLGVYDSPAAAQARSRELSALVPDLFSLKQGNKVALYAGSYQGLDQARSFADQLYLRGIHVDEETVSLRMPLKKISFGSFSSRRAAEKAAKRAVAAGLTAEVVKR